jgi:hypothetical protein
MTIWDARQNDLKEGLGRRRIVPAPFAYIEQLLKNFRPAGATDSGLLPPGRADFVLRCRSELGGAGVLVVVCWRLQFLFPVTTRSPSRRSSVTGWRVVKASPSAVSMSAGRRRSPWHARAIMLRAHCRATIHPHRRGQLYYI